MSISPKQTEDAHVMVEELKKAVKATLLMLHPDWTVVVHGGSLRISELEPTGWKLSLNVDLEMQPRPPKKEDPAE